MIETEILYVHLFDTSLLFLQLEFWLALFRRLCGLCNQFPILCYYLYVLYRCCCYCSTAFSSKDSSASSICSSSSSRHREFIFLTTPYPLARTFPPPTIKTKTKRMIVVVVASSSSSYPHRFAPHPPPSRDLYLRPGLLDAV